LYINGVALGDFDVDDAESFMNDVATNGDLDIDYIAGKLSSYAVSSS
jgi:death-on-curing protein